MAALRVAPPIVGEIPNGIGTEIRINARQPLDESSLSDEDRRPADSQTIDF